MGGPRSQNRGSNLKMLFNRPMRKMPVGMRIVISRRMRVNHIAIVSKC